jgi:hypothetical protein
MGCESVPLLGALSQPSKSYKSFRVAIHHYQQQDDGVINIKYFFNCPFSGCLQFKYTATAITW